MTASINTARELLNHLESAQLFADSNNPEQLKATMEYLATLERLKSNSKIETPTLPPPVEDTLHPIHYIVSTYEQVFKESDPNTAYPALELSNLVRRVDKEIHTALKTNTINLSEEQKRKFIDHFIFCRYRIEPLVEAALEGDMRLTSNALSNAVNKQRHQEVYAECMPHLYIEKLRELRKETDMGKLKTLLLVKLPEAYLSSLCELEGPYALKAFTVQSQLTKTPSIKAEMKELYQKIDGVPWVDSCPVTNTTLVLLTATSASFNKYASIHAALDDRGEGDSPWKQETNHGATDSIAP